MDLLSQHEAFLRAIFDAPDDDTPRLVYADFLQENGEEERAELIRVQCELARRSPWEREDLDRKFLLLTRQVVLRKNLRADACNRGFSAGEWRATVSGDQLTDVSALRREIVADWPHWFGLTAVQVKARPPLDAARIDALFDLPAFARVTRLDLSGDERAEAHSPWSGVLAVYDLHPTIGTAGVHALAVHKGMRRIAELDLTNNDLDNDAARVLVRSPYLDNLRRLRLLEGNRFRGKVWQQVIERFGDDVVGAGGGDDPIPF